MGVGEEGGTADLTFSNVRGNNPINWLQPLRSSDDKDNKASVLIQTSGSGETLDNLLTFTDQLGTIKTIKTSADTGPAVDPSLGLAYCDPHIKWNGKQTSVVCHFSTAAEAPDNQFAIHLHEYFLDKTSNLQ